MKRNILDNLKKKSYKSNFLIEKQKDISALVFKKYKLGEKIDFLLYCPRRTALLFFLTGSQQRKNSLSVEPLSIATEEDTCLLLRKKRRQGFAVDTLSSQNSFASSVATAKHHTCLFLRKKQSQGSFTGFAGFASLAKLAKERKNLKKNGSFVDKKTDPIKIDKRTRWNKCGKIEFAIMSSAKFIQSGAHLGHKPIRNKPSKYPGYVSMSGWNHQLTNSLFGIRNSFSILNFNYNGILFSKAFNFVKEILRNGGTVLVVNSNPEFMKTVDEINENLDIGPQIGNRALNKNYTPFTLSTSTGRWVAGSLTNSAQLIIPIIWFSKCLKRLHLKETKHFPWLWYQKATLSFKGFVRLNNVSSSGFALRRATAKISPTISLKKDPDLIFFINPGESSKANKNILHEAFTKKIPTVGIVDSNSNFSQIKYPLLSNGCSKSFTLLCLKNLISLTQRSSKE